MCDTACDLTTHSPIFPQNEKSMTLRYALCTVGVFLAACGTGTASSDTDSTIQDSKEIIGGFDAKAKNLDAIGTIGTADPGQPYAFTCTATLIAPSIVITAKHCAMVTDTASPLFGQKLVNLMPMFFAVGPDANDPAKVVEIIATDLSPGNVGGAYELGNDVALMHLIEPIVDVTPLKIANGDFSTTDLNRGFASVGFGSKDNYEDLSGYLSSTRSSGKATLRALEGKYYELMFGTWDKFFTAMKSYFGVAVATKYEAVIHGWFDNTKIMGGGYEVWAGAAAGDGQVCHGDTGGPLLGKENTEKKIYGIASSIFFSSQLVCDYGTTYATFGEKTRKMISEGELYVDPCGGRVTSNGTCNGDVATRCTAKWEGDRSLSKIDCSILDQKCVVTESGRVGCSDDTTLAPAHPAVPTVKELRTAIVKASRNRLALPQ